MIFVNKKDLHFNIPSLSFLNEQTYLSFSYIGSYLNSEGYIGPSGCNGMAFDKINSLKLSFSESVERRALMFGGWVNKDGYVETWDILNQKISSLPKKYTKYRITHPHYIDTTGTASHYSSTKAIVNAIKELIEKNSVFLFWYGKKGFLINPNKYRENITYNRIRQENYNVAQYMNIDFYPLIVVVSIIHKDGIVVSSGVGSSFYINEAISKSLSEAYLLKWQQNRPNANNKALKNIVNKDYHKSCLQYLNSITIEYSHWDNLDNGINYRSQDELSMILSTLPNWVTNLHIILLPSVYKRLKCVKAFSFDMNNHIPLKERLDLEQTINKMTINLDRNKLNEIPECIII